MVIQGSVNEVGSDKMAVMAAIENARHGSAPYLDISLRQDGNGGLNLSLPASAGAGEPGAPATVWLINFDRQFVTDVTAGENIGRKMRNNHVVRAQKAIGTWTGAALEISLGADQLGGGEASDACAILVQSDNFGPIIGAASLWLGSEN